MSFAARMSGHASVANVVNPLPGANANHTVSDPADATATLTFNSNGTVSGTNDAPGNWYSPTTTGIGSSYWIRATLVSGDTPTGTLGSWVSLSAGQSWSFSQTIVGVKTCNLTIEIATDSGGTNIVATGTNNYTIYAEVSL